MDEPALADAIAEKVIDRLNGTVISSVLPAYAGQMLREAASHGQRQQTNLIYLSGPNCLNTRWTINPNGTLQLEIDDPTGHRIWIGMFRPADAEAKSDG